MTVDVEDGRAVALGGDPDHRFTRGFLCAKVNRYLERVYSPERILHPLRRVGRKGEGRFERISWDEALDDDRRAPARGRRRARAAGDPALLLRGQHGPALLRQHGPALLPRARGEPARPDHLRDRGRRRLQGDDRQVARLRPRGDRPRPADPGLGRQHRQLQRPPVAVRRGGAAARRAPRHDRPLPLAHRRAVRPAPRAAARDGRGAGARDDARHLPRRPRGPRLPRALHAGRRRAARARGRVDAERAVAATTGLPAAEVEWIRARVRDHAAHGDPPQLRAEPPRRRRRWRCARSPACPPWSGTGATPGAASCSPPRGRSRSTRPRCSGRTSSRPARARST